MTGVLSTPRLLALWGPESDLLMCKSRPLSSRNQRLSFAGDGDRPLTARAEREMPCAPRVKLGSGDLQLMITGKTGRNTAYAPLVRHLEGPIPTPPPESAFSGVSRTTYYFDEPEDPISLMISHRSVSVAKSVSVLDHGQEMKLSPPSLPDGTPTVASRKASRCARPSFPSIPCNQRKAYHVQADQEAAISTANTLLRAPLHCKYPANFMRREGKKYRKFSLP